MNKSDLIEAMSTDAEISKVAAKAALESLMSNITSTLKSGGRVSIVGYSEIRACRNQLDCCETRWG